MEEKTNTTLLSTKNQDKAEGTATYFKGRKPLREADSKVKLMLILFSVFMYVVLFILLHYKIDYGMGIISIIPVVVVAWLYGFVPGICAAVLTFFTNIFLREYLGQEWIQKIIMQGGGILGAVASMFIGAVVGRMSDLSIRVRKELSQRKQVEEELANHRDNLEKLVEERTVNLQKEISVRKSTEDHLDNIIDSSLDSVVITDNIGNITRVNKEFLELLGYREEAVIGRHTTELSPSEEGSYESTVGGMVEINEVFIKEAKKMHSRLLEEGKIKNWKRYFIRNDQIIVPVEVNTVLLYTNEGDFSGSVGILRDITERKKIEEELTKAKNHLNDIIESSLDAILVADEWGYITKANKYFQELLGFTEEEILGKHVTELTLMDVLNTYESTTGELVKIDENYIKDSRTMIYKLHEEGKVSNWESYYFRKDKKVVPVEQNIVDLHHMKGERTGSVAIIRDITGRKKIEQQLLQSEKLKSLGELSGGVAHDFNNVLAAILGRVQLLKMQLNPPLGKQEKRKSVLELKRGLEIIEKASLDGAETVRRIQEFARKRADDKDFTQVDINELIDNVLEFTRVRWKNDAESKGIKFRIKKELSQLTPILGSSSELREVFTNLINNAIDAMPQGGEIRVTSLMDYTNVVVKIEDTGSGIPETIKDRIFDPFFTSKGVQSTGLGLSVSYGIINRHRGTVTVDSVEGEGTTFTIKFPVTQKVGKKNVKKEKVIPLKSKQKKASILVIEDEEDIRQLLRDILTCAGHDVEIANGGSEGIEIFKKKKFDLVFTDLGMPVMSGWEVAEKVKSINEKVPVALITGWNVKLDGSGMNDSGINLVIQKPFKMEQVLSLVQEGMLLRDQLKAV